MMRKTLLVIAVLTAFSFLLLLVSSCSEKSMNTGGSTTTVGMSLKIASPGMVDDVSDFRVIVTADDIKTPIESPLDLIFGDLVGSVSVPPGPNRTFTVEASNVVGVVLYRGATTVNIDPDSQVELLINLYPEVSLARVFPRYLSVAANSQFSVDVRVFNVPDLYGIALLLHWQGTIIYPDSAASLLPLSMNPIFVARIEPNFNDYSISATQTARGVPIVDANGDADIARVWFTSFTPDMVSDSASLLVEVTALTDTSGASILIGDVSIDGSTIVVGNPVF